MQLDLDKKKNLVDKYLRKNRMVSIFDIYFENIENVSMYIVLTYQLKSKTYRVNWIDLTAMENGNVANWFNSNLLFPEKAEQFKTIIAQNANCESFIDSDEIDSKVIMNSYITNYVPSIRRFEFKRYIPKCWLFLSNAILILFNNLPRTCFSFYQIMMEKLVKPEKNFIFYYDQKHNDIEKLFDERTKEAGKILYKKDSILYLEKVKDVYYGIVADDKKYLIEIMIKNDVKEIQLLCTCNCKSYCQHLYACLLGINAKKEKRFYKISYKNEGVPLLERIEKFNYYLCLGIEDNAFVTVDGNRIIMIPILDKNGKMNWEIVEDDDKNTLEHQLSVYLKESKK